MDENPDFPEKPRLFPRIRPQSPPSAPPAEMPSVGLNELIGRLRVYEGRYGELRKNLVIIEQNMLAHQKKTNMELKDIYSELSELRRQITDVQGRIITVIKELGLLATKSEVKVLSRVLDYLDPVKFVRVDQVEKIIKDVIEEHRQEKDEEEESVPKSL